MGQRLSWRTHFEEDSPGNYVICETAGRLEVVGYDALGGEQVIVIRDSDMRPCFEMKW